MVLYYPLLVHNLMTLLVFCMLMASAWAGVASLLRFLSLK